MGGLLVTISALKQFIPLYIYAVVGYLLCFLVAGKELSTLTIILLLSAGFLSWSLIEYALHRFIFHYDARSGWLRKLLYQAHISHHDNPDGTGRHFASLLLSAPIATAYWSIAWIATGSIAMASYLFVGMAAGYCTYEWLHFQCHHGRSRLRVLRYLRKYHLLHHHRTPDLRFGVTSPLLDLVFGTYQPVVKQRVRMRPAD